MLVLGQAAAAFGFAQNGGAVGHPTRCEAPDTRPWKIRRRMVLAPKTEEIQEYVCKGPNSAAHMPQ